MNEFNSTEATPANSSGFAPDADESGLRPVARLSMGDGFRWIKEGVQLWRRAPLNLTALGIIATLLFIGVQFLPVLGGLLGLLFWPHLSAGLYLAYRHAYEARPVLLTDLFQPFRQPGKLLLAGGIYTLAVLALFIGFVGAVLAQVGLEQMQAWLIVLEQNPGDPRVIEEAMPVLAWPLVFTLLFSVVVSMVFVFVPILLHQHGKAIHRAMGLSFKACLRNIPAFFLWSLIWFVVMLVLNLLPLIPVVGGALSTVGMLAMSAFVMGSLYAAYLDIFIR